MIGMKRLPLLLSVSLFSVLLPGLIPQPARAEFINPRQPTASSELQDRVAAGDPAAQALLGWSLRYGVGVTRDPLRSLEMIQNASESGHPFGLFLLCEATDDGYGVPRNHERAAGICAKALPGLNELASAGDAHAQYMLGYVYDRGLGTAKDPSASLDFYTRAAEQGHPFAQNNLGFLYKQQQNWDQALNWYTRAAEQGDATAQNNLGYAYQHGEGVSQDMQAAMKWYKLAAEQGDASAINNIASLFAQGLGVEADPAAAARWYRLAADRGHPVAQYNLGLAYLLGKGLVVSHPDALIWLLKAAEKGLPEAQYEAGKLYLEGTGVTLNPTEAQRLLQLAARQGHRQANDLLMRRF